jgi:CHAD domain-containing protein
MLHGVEHGDVRSVHRARVASRRLRELLPVLQLDAGTARKVGRRLRRITRRLGALRELDVLLTMIDELREPRRSPSRALEHVAGEIRKARTEGQDKLERKPVMTELRRIGRKLETVTDRLQTADADRPRDRAWRWAIEARVARRAMALRTAMEQAGALYLPERLHAVRIALKKLRYGVEVGAEAMGADRSADLRTLKRAQEVLGRLHDSQVLIDRVRCAQASLDPPDLAVWRELGQLVTVIEENCRRLHARYVRERAAIAAVCGRLLVRSARPPRHAAVRRAG